MLIRDLISQLEQLIVANEPHKHILGEAEIMIDIFGAKDESEYDFVYKGISPDVRITTSADGVYNILTAFERTAAEGPDPYATPD
mgnify:CR=1 FL=1